MRIVLAIALLGAFSIIIHHDYVLSAQNVQGAASTDLTQKCAAWGKGSNEIIWTPCPEIVAPLFDVPPKIWHEDKVAEDAPSILNRTMYSAFMSGCISCRVVHGVIVIPIDHYVCADKTRFKLQSEDGKWHCLRLVVP